MHVIHDPGFSAGPRAEFIGKKIFDLSVNIRIRETSRVHDIVSAIASEACNDNLRVHILPRKQFHVTFVNPIFRIEHKDRDPLPPAEEQADLYDDLRSALRHSAARDLMSDLAEHEIDFTEITLMSWNISLTGYMHEFAESQLQMEKILRSWDRRFDFASGHPLLHLTILRILPGALQSDCDRLLLIASKKAQDSPPILKHRVTPEDFLAVRFHQLHMPWDIEARGPEFICAETT